MLVENFLDRGKTLVFQKIFACGKRLWWRENLSLRKTSLMKEKPWLLERFPDEGKIFAWGTLPLGRKNLDLWKNSLIKEKFWRVEEKFLDKGKFLHVENFLDKGKILHAENFLDGGKSLLAEKVLYVGKLLACGNFLEEEKIFACVKPPWLSKNLGLLKHFLIVEK